MCRSSGSMRLFLDVCASVKCIAASQRMSIGRFGLRIEENKSMENRIGEHCFHFFLHQVSFDMLKLFCSQLKIANDHGKKISNCDYSRILIGLAAVYRIVILADGGGQRSPRHASTNRSILFVSQLAYFFWRDDKWQFDAAADEFSVHFFHKILKAEHNGIIFFSCIMICCVTLISPLEGFAMRYNISHTHTQFSSLPSCVAAAACADQNKKCVIDISINRMDERNIWNCICHIVCDGARNSWSLCKKTVNGGIEFNRTSSISNNFGLESREIRNKMKKLIEILLWQAMLPFDIFPIRINTGSWQQAAKAHIARYFTFHTQMNLCHMSMSFHIQRAETEWKENMRFGRIWA